jgi:hypothetical protein
MEIAYANEFVAQLPPIKAMVITTDGVTGDMRLRQKDLVNDEIGFKVMCAQVLSVLNNSGLSESVNI